MTYTNIIRNDIENAKAAKTLEEKVTAKRQLNNDLHKVFDAYQESRDQFLNDLFFEGAAVHSTLLTQDELINECKRLGTTIAAVGVKMFHSAVAQNCTEEALRVFKASLITDFFGDYWGIYKTVEGGFYQRFWFPDDTMLVLEQNAAGQVSVKEQEHF